MNEKISIQYRFWILMGVILIAGISQGMLLPVISILFEQSGISSSLNGLHTTGVYIGILAISPFMEGILRKFGYKSTLFIGGLMIVLSLALFPIWKSFWFWFILRLISGVGNSMLQVTCTTWITSFSLNKKRGFNIALTGLFFGAGFGIGPMMTPLLEINDSLPFILTAFMAILACLLVLLLKNEYPEQDTSRNSLSNTFHHAGKALKFSWIAFLFPFGYGFLEASLNSNFPVYALHIGMDVNSVSFILPAFAIGSVVLQLPLGSWSDHYGRKKVLQFVMIAGMIAFILAGIFQDSFIALLVCFFIAGMFVGSIYSLGVSYMVDLIPKYLLPIGNIICSVFYSFGSISGPVLGGLSIQFINGINFFYIISCMLAFLFIALIFFKPKKEWQSEIRSIS